LRRQAIHCLKEEIHLCAALPTNDQRNWPAINDGRPIKNANTLNRPRLWVKFTAAFGSKMPSRVRKRRGGGVGATSRNPGLPTLHLQSTSIDFPAGLPVGPAPALPLTSLQFFEPKQKHLIAWEKLPNWAQEDWAHCRRLLVCQY
jgi:hypothetical protein